jgi:acetate kinase
VKILVANIGSTSFKYQLFDISSGVALAKGRVERIGQPGGCPDYASAIEQSLGALIGSGRPLAALTDLDAVGFKAVHAGPEGGLQLVDDQALEAMERFSFLAPAHNPPYIQAMRAFRETLAGVPLVALFETAFFALPEAARTYAIPYDWTSELAVRRYGFHGASHRYAAERARAILGRNDLRQVSCHLGGSSSVAAIKDGVGVDSSFGMSPQSGLPQNNRVGDIDAFAVLHVMKERGLGVDEMARILARDSGLLGVSGTSGDLRDLMGSADPRAKLAVDVLVYWVRRYLGAFMVGLGGLDAISFSGGIGENSAEMRAAVCRGLEAFGVRIDESANRQGSGERDIAPPGIAVRLLVIPADEEWIVARYTAELLEKQATNE